MFVKMNAIHLTPLLDFIHQAMTFTGLHIHSFIKCLLELLLSTKPCTHYHNQIIFLFHILEEKTNIKQQLGNFRK